MECLDPMEFEGEDPTAENIGYCELHPECCETVPPERTEKQPSLWSRVVGTILRRREH